MTQLSGIGTVVKGGKESTPPFSQIIQFQQSLPLESSSQTLKLP